MCVVNVYFLFSGQASKCKVNNNENEELIPECGTKTRNIVPQIIHIIKTKRKRSQLKLNEDEKVKHRMCNVPWDLVILWPFDHILLLFFLIVAEKTKKRKRKKRKKKQRCSSSTKWFVH